MTNFVTYHPPHPKKGIIDLLCKNNRIRKKVTNFKTPIILHPLGMNVINISFLF